MSWLHVIYTAVKFLKLRLTFTKQDIKKERVRFQGILQSQVESQPEDLPDRETQWTRTKPYKMLTWQWLSVKQLAITHHSNLRTLK